jgi:hypothetical protein
MNAPLLGAPLTPREEYAASARSATTSVQIPFSWTPDVRKAFRSERAANDALRLVIELRKVGSHKRRDYSSSGP